MKRVAAGLVLLVFAACGGGSSSHTITGRLDILDDCFTYDDIDQGTQVVVKDGDDKTLATSQLGEGKDKPLFSGSTKLDDIANEVVPDLRSCVYRFKVPDVPDVSFYSVEVSHRGALTFSHAKLERQNWKVGLTLG